MARKCPLCGSRKWKRDRVTGNAVCEDGHVLQDYRSELLVIDGGVNFQLQRRRTAKGPRTNKQRTEGRKNKELYHGNEAEYMKIQGLQLLIRHQSYTLSKLWQLPEAFEMIVRDLWAYQLSISVLPDIPAPPVAEEETPIQHSKSLPKLRIDPDPQPDTRDEHSSSDSQSDSDEGESEPDDNIDPELLRDLEEGDGDGEDVEDGAKEDKNTRGDARWKRKRRLRAADTITTLVLALWMMRVPVMGSDIESLVNSVQIPYVDFGHSTYIPENMKKRLNRSAVQALSPRRSPSPSKIHDSCRIFARILYRKYGVHVPLFNFHPVSWSIASSLGGTQAHLCPAMMHALLLRLMDLISVPFHLTTHDLSTITRKPRAQSSYKSRSKAKPKTKKKPRPTADDEDGDSNQEDAPRDEQEEGPRWEKYERTKRMYDELPPELSIVSAWVLLMKLVYGLDGRPRAALLSRDPAIGLPKGEIWLRELDRRLGEGILSARKKAPRISQAYFVSMEDADINSFLDNAEHILLDHHAPGSDATHFPLPPSSPVLKPNKKSWTAFHSDLTPVVHTRPPLAQSSQTLPLMPGEKTRSYDTKDAFGLYPREMEVVLKSAGEAVGFDWKEVGKVVKHWERKLEKVKGERRKAGRSLVSGYHRTKHRPSKRPSRPRTGSSRQPTSRDPSRARSKKRTGSTSVLASREDSRARPRTRASSRAESESFGESSEPSRVRGSVPGTPVLSRAGSRSRQSTGSPRTARRFAERSGDSSQVR
ncbi:hypothetical protein L198_06473 [Cryptococcus wingfieldii CBS 7118]|uniref:Rrn7/TAF1B N-terminal cyclin domain-containing protein n=1 Tax=Cryptococcus wingfieldii CBS 7118 TaxID=1295528 RepID=A0A1E3IKM4_9TREE|nr:hypothetical protein L198_06473 [Cryptococcus wingfieldii CBS 7118]ODN89154.1 hypothetical protein L198_06473 [Cryptococcus wingfieldii CBS 7118]